MAPDAAGNQTQIASPTSTLDTTFDDASRQAATSDSTFQIANRYDGRGFLERSERTYPGALFADGFEAGNTTCWSTTIGGPTTGTCPTNPQSINPTYTSDGLLQHLTRGFTGEEQKWVLYHAGRPVAIVRQTGTAPAAVTFLTTDHLGTPVLAMDGAGLEVWEGGFEPFGADFSDAEGAGVFLRFPGQWVDGLLTEGGLYNVHRWYDAMVARSRLSKIASRLLLHPVFEISLQARPGALAAYGLCRGEDRIALPRVLEKLATTPTNVKEGLSRVRHASLFTQRLQHVSRTELRALVKKHRAERGSKGFTCWTQWPCSSATWPGRTLYARSATAWPAVWGG